LIDIFFFNFEFLNKFLFEKNLDGSIFGGRTLFFGVRNINFGGRECIILKFSKKVQKVMVLVSGIFGVSQWIFGARTALFCGIFGVVYLSTSTFSPRRVCLAWKFRQYLM
jgi:hypothetical protein